MKKDNRMKIYKWIKYEDTLMFVSEKNKDKYTIIYHYDEIGQDIIDYWDSKESDIKMMIEYDQVQLSIRKQIEFILKNKAAIKYYKNASKRRELVKHIFGD